MFDYPLEVNFYLIPIYFELEKYYKFIIKYL